MKESIVPFSKKTWSEIVFEKLKQLIEDGFWKPEEKIYTEAELCEKFNVSRSTVREAINMLKANNLVYAIPGNGTFVSNRQAEIVFANGYRLDLNSEKSLLDVMELRLAIEPLSASLAANRLPDEDFPKLGEVSDRYAADLESGPQYFAETDLDFHMFIAEATGNKLIMNTMSAIQEYLRTQLITSNHVFSHRDVAMSYHRRIVDAIFNHDSDAAEQAMREHMREAFQFMLTIINTEKKNSGRILPLAVENSRGHGQSH